MLAIKIDGDEIATAPTLIKDQLRALGPTKPIRRLESFAARIELEAWIFLAASGAAIFIALITVIGHALLVARSKPVAALRYE